MAGQQQIEVKNQEVYYEKYLSNLKKEADLYFLEKRFALDTDFDRQKMRYSQLLEKTLNNDTCELMDWVWKKIEGKLINRVGRPTKDLNVITSIVPDITINNIFNINDDWDSLSW